MREKRSKKPSKYTMEKKRSVIMDVLNTGDPLEVVAKRNGVEAYNIYQWLHTFGISTPSERLNHLLDMDKKELTKSNAELSRALDKANLRISELELELKAKTALMDEVLERHHIEVKKKIALKP